MDDPAKPQPDNCAGAEVSRARAAGAATALAALMTIVPIDMGALGTHASASPARRSAPMDRLTGVSCAGPRMCMAVGFASGPVALAELWSGSTWMVVRTPNPPGTFGNVLNNVSCSMDTDCIAVGYANDNVGLPLTLAEHWDGIRWAVQAPPSGKRSGFLTGVSCSSPSACTAVGSRVQRWNGTEWTAQATPIANAALIAVSCSTLTSCTAAGYLGARALVERWNGTTWAMQPTPSPAGSRDSSLSGLACTSPAACVAVGDYDTGRSDRTLSERWNGTRWSIQPTPNRPGGSNFLSAVSCGAATACSAVGVFLSDAQVASAFAEQWNGARWTIEPVATPRGALVDQLYGVGCSAAAACAAVGDDFNSGDANLTLAERWNGTTWTVQRTPSP